MTLPTVHDRFDSGSRYLIKLQPAELIQWRLRGEVVYRTWLDTRTIPFPGTPARICDTVCHCEEADGRPWAIPVESQTRPDPDMFARLLSYLGHLAVEKRPDPEPGSRFKVAAVVFNLTGRGNTSRDDHLRKAKVQTCLRVDECDLSELDALTTLRQIGRGRVPPCVLGWIPLMQNGGEPGTLKAWRRLASGEQDSRRRGDYGFLALLFAELTGTDDIWRSLLEDWNVTESRLVQDWLTQERLRTLRQTLRLLLEDRFRELPQGVGQRIEACGDAERLQTAVRQVTRLGSLDELTI
jgi:hypothetical protein